MAKTDYKTIDDYHRLFPVNIQERMQTIRNIIHEIVPDVNEVISYQIPAFKIDRSYLIYYAAFKNHLSLTGVWSDSLLSEFKNDLEKYKVSKSVIQLPNNNELPVNFIKRLIKFRLDEIKERK